METNTPPSDPFPIPETDEELISQCRVETFTSGGKGGQHQNRTESGVRLVHLPTGIVASSREERSQHRNKSIAIERLREALKARNYRPKPRRPTRVPPAEKRRRVDSKKKRGHLKRTRKPPPPNREE